MVLDSKPRGDEAPNLGNSGFDRIRTLTAKGFEVYLKLSECERYQGDCNQARVTVTEREHYYHGFGTTGGLHTRLTSS